MLGRALSRRTLLAALPALAIAPGMPSVTDASDRPDGDVAHLGSDDVSPELIRTICAHCAAYAGLRKISRETDAVAIGRPATVDELSRLDAATDLEEQLLLALCHHSAANDTERHDKATYLLGIFEGNDPESELVTAILLSMTREVQHQAVESLDLSV
ncbi:hypothetical protein [Mesorhizobium sp. M0698]|uniref:hypothetical protein n=1 Tax=Mesorhizobium sp. M0698 TaxID=2956987 RepID=UPI003337218C